VTRRARGIFGGLDERGLKLVLVAFFLALAIPSAVLIAQAYSQLKWGAFRALQVEAEELAARIDITLRGAIAVEDARSFGDYSFLVVEGDAAANFLQRSPLSEFPVTSAVPGVLGHFQIDAAGWLTSPLLPESKVAPASYGIPVDEQAARAASIAELRDVLVRNRLVRNARDDFAAGAGGQRAQELERRQAVVDSPAALREEAERVAPTAETSQAAFDRLATGALSSSTRVRAPASTPPAIAGAEAPNKEDQAAANAVAPEPTRSILADEALLRSKRVEQALVPEPAAVAAAERSSADDATEAKLELTVRTFESEIDPLELGVLDTGHLVLFRNAWRDGQRYIQGALVDHATFVTAAVAAPYRASNLAGATSFTVLYRDSVLEQVASSATPYPRELAGTPLYRARLSPPFGDFELSFAVDALPRAPGSAVLAWVAVTLGVVLVGGFLLMYRFAIGQMRLARQQQDFVSAVSHELKTPLTSIRMYGEMLKAGWADEPKKRVYYDYIHSESERLSRLIDNVLQLARLTRNTQSFDLKPFGAAELLDMVRSKVGTQVERAGFTLDIRNDVAPDATVVVDDDAFAQIFINLVDNALKFSASAAVKVVEIGARQESDGGLLFTVRDHGPGVRKAEMKKIFELFYRPENELTRETVGTGIGLALVRQLAAAMGARVDLRNCDPGAEFRLHFPAQR
jgi:signal transduction histidine kinase